MARHRTVAAGAALALSLWLSAGPARAQEPPPADATESMAVAPITCWWRTSTDAIRVGELFTLVLTCSVLETAATTVVPDQSRLDPAVLQLQPFEIVGGTQAAETRTVSRRFFQYEYDVRYIGEDFGVDMMLPSLPVTYRVESRLQPDQAIESRDRQYVLPAHRIRIASLVPATARDIRDQPPESFRNIAARRFRARAIRIGAWTLFGGAAVLLLWVAIRLARRRGAGRATPRPASDGAVLRAAAHDLEAVSRQRQIEGWDPALTARALAALRIAATYAVSGHVAQTTVDWDAVPDDGQLLVRSRLGRDRPVAVSGAVTAETVARARRQLEGGRADAPRLADLEAALGRLATAVYGHESSAPTADELDEALADGRRITAGLRRDHALANRVLQMMAHVVGEWRHRVWRR